MKATETKPRMRTRSVLGYRLTLEAGKRYLATRPMLGGRTSKNKLPVRIVEAEKPFGGIAAEVDTMPYDKANRFLDAFNKGKTSFDGRVW